MGLFQGNYTRRLAKRLIFGQSSNTEAERVMIEKLKTVCVYEFSSKIKRMYEDIKNSACQQEKFNKISIYQIHSKLPYKIIPRFMKKNIRIEDLNGYTIIVTQIYVHVQHRKCTF